MEEYNYCLQKMKNVVSKVWIWIGLYKHAANNNAYFFIMNKYITYGFTHSL